MAKHFIFGDKKETDKNTIEKIRKGEEIVLKASEVLRVEKNESKISQEDNLCFIRGRVIVKLDIQYKNTYTFSNGTKIRLERQFNELNRRITEPCNAVVISGENLISGSEILIHPNSIHDSNRIYNYKDSNDDIKYYSIHDEMCFAWHDGKEWKPIYPYDFALQVYKPYEGGLIGIEPELLKDTLFVTTGELKGQVVKTVKAANYVIIFQNKDGREGQLLRFRPFGDPRKKMEEEAVAILHDHTKKVLSGKYLVGLNISDAKKLNELSNG